MLEAVQEDEEEQDPEEDYYQDLQRRDPIEVEAFSIKAVTEMFAQHGFKNTPPSALQAYQDAMLWWKGGRPAGPH